MYSMPLWLILLPLFCIVIIALYRLGLKYRGVEWGHRAVDSLDGLLRLLCFSFHRLSTNGIALPKYGPAIVVANHISGLDPLLVLSASSRPIRFLIAREEYERFGLKWLFKAVGCIPVDRSSRPEVALREAKRALDNGEVIGIFPHGKIHLDSDPPRRIKAGAIRLSQMVNVAIHPCRIEGVKGEGYTLLSLFMRSKATLHAYAPEYCYADQDACVDRIELLLNRTISDNQNNEEEMANG